MITDVKIHEQFMRQAIDLARDAASKGDKPFGCMILRPNPRGWGCLAATVGTGTDQDPTSHSEVRAIQTACDVLQGPLHGCVVYSTHEPCVMCAGALVHAKPDTVVWGSCRRDLPELFRPRLFDAKDILYDCSRPINCVRGVLRDECIALFDEELALVRSK